MGKTTNVKKKSDLYVSIKCRHTEVHKQTQGTCGIEVPQAGGQLRNKCLQKPP
jgi:hypothetical protein